MSDLQLAIRHFKRSNSNKLDLSGKNMTFIPGEIYALEKLEILDLSNNKITSIDPKIAQMKNLKILDLSNNSLM